MKHSLYYLLVLSLSVLSCNTDKVEKELDNFSVSVAAPTDGKTAWTSGDRIRAYSITDGTILSNFTLSTSESGATARFSANETVKQGEEYRFLFPEQAVGRSLSTAGFITLPAAQTATAGGSDPSASPAFAQVTDITGTVHMEAVTGFVSFSLNETAAEVQSVTLEAAGGEQVAGTMRITPGSSLSVKYEDSGSSSITLSGTFEAGKEYRIAVIPGSYSGFQLTFRDADARISKHSLSGAEVGIGQNLQAGQFAPAFEGAHDWVTYHRSTKEGISPLVLVFMAEGFTEERRDVYLDICRAGADYIFSVEPFKHFKDYFSVYIGWEPATAMGPGSPWNVPTYKDANGRQSFNSMGQDKRDKVYNWIAQKCPEVLSGKTDLNNVGVFMMIDCGADDIGAVCDWDLTPQEIGRFVALVAYAPDKIYGSQAPGKVPQTYGANYYGYYEPADDGSVTKLSMEELESIGYKTVYGGTRAFLNDYRGTLLHEGMGHGFTHLLDEYWIYYTPGDNSSYYTYPHGTWNTSITESYYPLAIPTGLNLSPAQYNNPWKNLNDMKEELIAKDKRYERMGSYQGGGVQYMFGIWRPERVSVMMDSRPYFATWQRALAWQRIMRSSGEKPNCDVVNNIADLREYMEIDVAIEGIRDPTRDAKE